MGYDTVEINFKNLLNMTEKADQKMKKRWKKKNKAK